MKKFNKKNLNCEEGKFIFVIVSDKNYDKVCFDLRRNGFEIRDSVIIYSPTKQGLVVIARKKTDKGFVDLLVRKSKKPLDIEKGRISTKDDIPEFNRNNSSGEFEPSGNNPVKRSGNSTGKGRWPSNILFQHNSKCEYKGTKKVEITNGSGIASNKGGTTGMFKMGERDYDATYTENDGKEKVDNWNCVDNCPVYRLSKQSGITKSAKVKTFTKAYKGESKTGFMRGQSTPQSQYEDEGTASRFYLQVNTFEEIIEYLENLVGSKSNVLLYEE